MNSLFANDITLDHKNHTYQLSDNPGIDFASVTEFIHKFFRKFNQEKTARKLIKEHPKYIDMTVEQLIKEWGKGAKRGTIVHNELELFIKDGTEPKNSLACIGAEWLKEKKKNLENTFYSEVIVYSEELKVAGTIDLLVYNKEQDMYHLVDWKTNKRISEESFGNKKGILNSTQHLDDCNFIHYSLQLSFYRYILENYYRLKIGSQTLFHLKEDKFKTYSVNYHEDDLVNMLKEKELL